MPPPTKTAASTRLHRPNKQDGLDRRAKTATGLSSAPAARAILATHDTLIALARDDDTGTAAGLVPLMLDRLLGPYLGFAKQVFETAEKVLGETQSERFVLKDTVIAGKGGDHARGESEARVLLMERLGEELRGKLEGEENGEGTKGVSEEMVEGWVEDGWLQEEMVREWLGVIVEDMGGEGW